MKQRLTWLILTIAVIGFLGVPLMIRASEPPFANVTDRVDLIEVNHVYDVSGRHVLDQVIFYDWSASHSAYQVVAWRLYKRPEQYPRMNWRISRYVARWRDGQMMREVTAGQCRETWTTYDPEVMERDYLPVESRRELSGNTR